MTSKARVLAASAAIALVIVIGTALPIRFALQAESAEGRELWASIATIVSTTAATLVVGGIAVWQTLANSRLHMEAEAARSAEAKRERDDRQRIWIMETMRDRLTDWRKWTVNLHADNPGNEAFIRSQFREIGVDYDEFLRLMPDIAEAIRSLPAWAKSGGKS